MCHRYNRANYEQSLVGFLFYKINKKNIEKIIEDKFMQHVTKYDLTFSGVRILAIYMALVAVSSATSAAFMAYSYAHDGRGYSINLFFPAMLAILFYIACPIVLWILSSTIARFITTNKTHQPLSSNESSNLLGIAFSSIGMFLLATVTPVMIGVVMRYIRMKSLNQFEVVMSNEEYSIYLDLTVDSLKILIGVFLLFAGSKISTRLVSFRNAGKQE